MIFEDCIYLKSLIVKYNRRQYLEDNYLHYEFGMFNDGEWSCELKCNGCVDVREFKEIYDYIATLYVCPFMYGSRLGFSVQIQ